MREIQLCQTDFEVEFNQEIVEYDEDVEIVTKYKGKPKASACRHNINLSSNGGNVDRSKGYM